MKKILTTIIAAGLMALNSYAALVISNSAATTLTTTSMYFNAILVSTNSVPGDVSATVYYGTVDYTTNNNSWAYSNKFSVSALGNISTQITALSPSHKYYFTWHAKDASNTDWATPSLNAWTKPSAPTSTPAVVTISVQTDIAAELKAPTNFFGKNVGLIRNALSPFGYLTNDIWSSATNNLAIRVAIMETGKVDRVDTNNWEVGSHAALNNATNTLNTATNALQIQVGLLQGATGVLNSATSSLNIAVGLLNGATGVLNSATGALQVQVTAAITGKVDRVGETNVLDFTNAHVRVSNPTDGTDAANADWTRKLLAGGQFFYACTNVNPVNTNFYELCIASNSVNASRLYTNPTNGQYVGTVMTTDKYFSVISPMSVNAYLGASANTINVHPEFYYTYDGTNLLGDWPVQAQTITTGSNLYTWVIAFPTITATNTTGFYLVRRFKVDSNPNNRNLTFYLSGSTPSHIAFATAPTTDLGIRGATGIVAGASDSYNTTTRVMTWNTNAAGGGSASVSYGITDTTAWRGDWGASASGHIGSLIGWTNAVIGATNVLNTATNRINARLATVESQPVSGWSGYNATQQVVWIQVATNLVVTGTVTPNVNGTYLELSGSVPRSWTLNGTNIFYEGVGETATWILLDSSHWGNTLAPGDPNGFVGTYSTLGSATGNATVVSSVTNVTWKAGFNYSNYVWRISRDNVVQADATNIATLVQIASLNGATGALNTAIGLLQGATNVLNSATNTLDAHVQSLIGWTNAVIGATNVLNSATNVLDVLARAALPASFTNTGIMSAVQITGLSGNGVVPVGAIQMYAAAAAPAGWLLCNGASIATNTYPTLFATIGTTFGSTNAAWFNVPNLTDNKFPLGGSAGLGGTGGGSSVTLNITQIPSHGHEQKQFTSGSGTTIWLPHASANAATPALLGIDTASVGGGLAHTNMPPYLIVNFIIKY